MTAATATTADTFRPALHYAARNTWLNDPNGLIFHEGVYHLYYQNNPLDNVWGNMSWGHATSTDLLTWTEHPVAIACDDNEQYVAAAAEPSYCCYCLSCSRSASLPHPFGTLRLAPSKWFAPNNTKRSYFGSLQLSSRHA